MSRDNKYIIRRTLSQERFEVLWKKRRDGKATLRDLTEMDEIINRDEGVRRFVLEEMEKPETPTDNQDMLMPPAIKHQSIISKIKGFFNRLFNMVTAPAKLSATANY
ncbi:hypothetical protein [Mucilaginibacter phyllosphaerae]